ncbi:MAG: 23S rRNA (uracil(1939)-C(5))-methyltransferase RlmD [Ignavibacteriales bacterium]|nr:23S rRNA (uracil(1939)-C(5))-methyltransferase RlmD [Ignavibacteriales bacterium]
MVQRGDLLDVLVETTGLEGKSIARYEGMVFFVEGAVPGDRLKVQVLRTKKKHAEAKIVEILAPSSRRTVPKCSHFGVCGGCSWQHAEYSLQCEQKENHVREALEHIGGIHGVPILPILTVENPFFYRNKLEFSFGDKRWLTYEEAERGVDATVPLALGFHAPQRYDKIISIDQCHLQSEVSNRILSFIRAYALANNLPPYSLDAETGYLRNLVVREGKNTGDSMVNIVTFDDRPDVMRNLTAALLAEIPDTTTVINNVNTRKSNIAVGDFEKIYHGDGTIRDMIGNRTFHISANSFFQTNTRQAERLYQVTKEFAAITPDDLVYDLYCGTGTISIFIADSVRKVIGIDIVESSIANAKANAALNNCLNCEFIAGDLKDLLTKDRGWMNSNYPPDALIIDPPRSGMHPKAIEELGRMKIARIVYVSCNPATLARDAKMLLPFGYQIEKVQPVDMFPHTNHVESVAQLRLIS